MENVLKDRSIQVRLQQDLPLIHVDGVLIEQVFMNILDNAVKYTPVGSPIDINARLEKENVIITISDRGPGFAAGDEEKIFDKFFRGPTTTYLKGAGLGLAICRGFINAHSGRITARNGPEGGAVFEIVLPTGGEMPKLDIEPADENISTRKD
jgi:two-component system sensor histidine kinase KdpD